MQRNHDTTAEILALFGALGWRESDEAEDLARVEAAGGQPRGRVTAASVLAKVHANQDVKQLPEELHSTPIIFDGPVATGFARAARNRKDIDNETEKRMREDKAKALREKEKPKDL